MLGSDIKNPVEIKEISGLLAKATEGGMELIDTPTVIRAIDGTNFGCVSLGWNNDSVRQLIELFDRVVSKALDALIKETQVSGWNLARGKLKAFDELCAHLIKKLIS